MLCVTCDTVIGSAAPESTLPSSPVVTVAVLLMPDWVTVDPPPEMPVIVTVAVLPCDAAPFWLTVELSFDPFCVTVAVSALPACVTVEVLLPAKAGLAASSAAAQAE